MIKYRLKIQFTQIILFTILYFLISTASIGCATVKEAALGIAGLSQKGGDESRKDALSKEFNLDYHSAYEKVKKILLKTGSYIYAQDPKTGRIAIYVSDNDTTPVGIFFTKMNLANTIIEVSSESTYAKELIAGRIFSFFQERPNAQTQK
ncbi:MAG: hypothetical protein QMD94_02620 [Candidatus Omnitrophota bacterium]|nr:hypothetical protein [Candidatus Omnitrophota bacterium]